MYKKTIKYEDFNGQQKSLDAYFNLNKSELLKMHMSVKGGFVETVQRIIDAQDQPSLIKIFEDLIKNSYGVKTPDGIGFVKNSDEIRRLGPGYMTYEDFVATDAYSELYFELATNAEAASEFINKVIPANLAKELAESDAQANVQALN